MTNKIIIGGALANTHGQAKTQDLVHFLAERTDDMDIYVLQARPGSITAAALDWQAILGTTADIIQVCNLLWDAFKKFIKPIRDKEKNSRSFLYIVVKHPDGRSMQFSLGTDILNKEDFMKLFKQAVQEIRTSSNPDGLGDMAIQEIEQSDIWLKINKKDS
jgi:hypothetical protein